MSTKQVREMFFTSGTHFSRAEDRAQAREELIFNVTEDLLVLMERMEVSKKELARRLGRSKSYVTQLLNGARNMTLGTLSDICFALDVAPRINLLDGDGGDFSDEPGNAHWEEHSDDDARIHYEILSRRNVVDRRDPSHWVNEAA
jgi:transcriptional regulator with XRE-family HTH domain